MDSGIINNIESLSRLLPIQVIFSIIVYHIIINSILTSLNYFQSWIQEIKKRYVSCLIDLMRTVSTFKIVNNLTPPTLTARQLYIYKHYSGHFLLYKKKTVLTKLKRKRIEKQNVIFSLELRSRLEILRALAFDLNSFLFIEQCFA